MAKTKPAKALAKSVTATPAKVLNGVKEGRVKKPSQSDKTKSKDIANSAIGKKDIEKKIRYASPSESEDEKSASSSSDDSESESEDASDDSSASESEDEAIVTKAAANGVNKDDESESSSESEESDDEGVPPKAKANGVPLTATAAANEEASSGSDSNSSESDDDNIADAGKFQPDSDASDDDDEDSIDSDNEEVEGASAPRSNGVSKKFEAADEDSEADSEESSDDSSASEEDEDDKDDEDKFKEEIKLEPKKRKADDSTEPTAKKTRIENGASENGSSKTLFVGRLSWNVDDESLYQEFQEFGEIVSCKVMYHKDSGKSKGFGYVEFSTVEEATAAKDTKHESLIDGRPVNIDFATPFQGNKRDSKDAYQQRSKKFGDVESTPSNTLFVGNLSFDATYDMIKEAFESYGTIERISLPTSREDGSPKGFGYVSYSTTEEATKAMNDMRGGEIAGRPVRLDFASPRPEGDSNGGGFRGGRGGRGGFRGGNRGGGFGGGFGGGRGGFGRGGRGGAPRGGRGGSTNRGGFGDFSGRKISF